MGAIGLASASNNFSYTAIAAPGSTPDGENVYDSDASDNVWTVTFTPGTGTGSAQGAYLGTAFSGETLSGWQIWDSPGSSSNSNGVSGNVDSVDTFAGGALSVGQTVSLNYEMRSTSLGTQVGVSLLNGSGAAITVGIFGQEPNVANPYTGNGYYYTDAGSTYAPAGSMGYQYQVEFPIAFTITGTNTYLATWGSDSWTGTFNGPLTGIDVFNYSAGNGSDVGFNNLTVQPSLIISNIFPNDLNALFNATNTFSFGAGSLGGVINASGVQLILNGVNVSSNLVVSGAGTENVSVKYTNLLLNTVYIGQINVTNAAGYSATAPVRFDTFSTNFFTWEAEDFDFNGGQFIDNPVISTNSPDSYYNQIGSNNVDEYVPNYSATQPHLWRTNDQVSIDYANDTPRAQFTAAGIPDYLVGYFDPSNWVNYTRTYPAGVYNIYGRLANGNPGLANCYLAEVTSGQTTSNQVTTQLGTFQFSGRGWNSFDFIPLTDQWGNLLAVTLNGKTTLQVTSGPLAAGGGVNMNFFMLAPGSNTPPAIANIYPDGSQPFESTNDLTFTVSSAVSTVSANNIQVTLNGINVSSQLAFTGSATNWQVSLPLLQGSYTCTITATDAAGHSNSYSETFDNFSQNNFMIEADEFDFNGGQWIDDSIQTATTVGATNSYYFYPGDNENNGAVYGVDFTTTNVTVAETYLYRVDGNGPGGYAAAGTELTSDFLRDKFINEGAGAQPPYEDVPNETVPTTNSDYDVGWFAPGTWLNYSRTFPTNNYHVYGRLSSGAAYAGAMMSLVTPATRGTMNQSSNVLGTFSDPNADGFQSWHWIPLMGTNGQQAVVSLGGVETLNVVAPPGSATGSMNSHFYMFVPFVAVTPFSISASASAGTISIKIPTQNTVGYTVQYSSSLKAPNWQTLTNITGNGAVMTVTDTIGAGPRFYRVEVE
jgi:hypothetical protein